MSWKEIAEDEVDRLTADNDRLAQENERLKTAHNVKHRELKNTNRGMRSQAYIHEMQRAKIKKLRAEITRLREQTALLPRLEQERADWKQEAERLRERVAELESKTSKIRCHWKETVVPQLEQQRKEDAEVLAVRMKMCDERDDRIERLKAGLRDARELFYGGYFTAPPEKIRAVRESLDALLAEGGDTVAKQLHDALDHNPLSERYGLYKREGGE